MVVESGNEAACAIGPLMSMDWKGVEGRSARQEGQRASPSRPRARARTGKRGSGGPLAGTFGSEPLEGAYWSVPNSPPLPVALWLNREVVSTRELFGKKFLHWNLLL